MIWQKFSDLEVLDERKKKWKNDKNNGKITEKKEKMSRKNYTTIQITLSISI